MRSAEQMGAAIGKRGWQLVYGGGRVGLMGALADAAMAAGAEVHGVIPQSLMQREVGHRALTSLQVVDTMHERKRRMAEHCHAFIALPGGIGTFEELFEVWSWRHLGYHEQPIGLLDVAGYFQPLLSMVRQAARAGFVTTGQIASVALHESPDVLLDEIAALAARRAAPDDLRRI
jgi:hypothetical protein